MKALSVATKILREQVRDLRTLALTVALPAGFMVVFGLAFGGGLPTYDVVVADDDGGPVSSAFVERLRGAAYDGGQPIFTVQTGTSAEAEQAVRADKAVLAVVIPPGFSAGALAPRPRVAVGTAEAAGAGGAEAMEPVAGGDPSDPRFPAAYWAMREELDAVMTEATGERPRGAVRSWLITESGGTTEFDYAAPGVMVFAIMLLVAGTAMIVVGEHQAGTLQRLRLTAMTGTDLFAGVALSQMVLACVQVPVMFGVALALGYHASGSLLAALPVGLALSLGAVGLGLLVACVARNPTEAANLGAGVLLPVTFLSGAFFPIPDLPVLTVAGRDLGPWHLLPARHALTALRQQLSFGASLGSVAFELVMTLVLGLATLWIGAMVFERTRMRRDA